MIFTNPEPLRSHTQMPMVSWPNWPTLTAHLPAHGVSDIEGNKTCTTQTPLGPNLYNRVNFQIPSKTLVALSAMDDGNRGWNYEQQPHTRREDVGDTRFMKTSSLGETKPRQQGPLEIHLPDYGQGTWQGFPRLASLLEAMPIGFSQLWCQLLRRPGVTKKVLALKKV